MDMYIPINSMCFMLTKRIHHGHLGRQANNFELLLLLLLLLLYSVGYLAPSVTGYGFHSAGYRIYDIEGSYNGSTRLTLDHYTYIMNITEANLNNEPKWILEYSAKVCIVVIIVIILLLLLL